ncbi:MAG TPA: GTP cyclohydrolase MptA [Gaiella sp.]|jgi:GTP cyclohydrolase I/GTP cyclohydrolase-4|nr:GTP cyclohydrolase MptA [Gaiella sp.]
MELPHVRDMQASAPPVEIALSHAGVAGVQKAIRIRRGEQEILMAAEIDCTVDLASGQKGVHMSRFPELFDEAIDEAVLGEGLLVEALADRIASQIVERQGALRAEVRIVARWPLRRRTPVTDLVTQEMVSLIGMAAANGRRSRRVVGVEATGINACPCAQDLVRGRAAERLADAGYDADEIDRILELVPIATHNQRGRGTLLVGTAEELDAEGLVEIVEQSMSAPVYELLKRADELHVVEEAHSRPRFVEDSVRVALKALLDAYPGLSDDDFALSRQRNLETIHDHDVVAERFGTIGELRAELEGRSPGAQTALATWLDPG